jgi:hypothetical protein
LVVYHPSSALAALAALAASAFFLTIYPLNNACTFVAAAASVLAFFAASSLAASASLIKRIDSLILSTLLCLFV